MCVQTTRNATNAQALSNHLFSRVVALQLAHKLVVRVLHGNGLALAILLLPEQVPHERRPVLGLLVRNVHGEAAREHLKVVAHKAQVLQPLHLVVPVVHEPLVEPRHGRHLAHHHVRLLRVALEALHARQQRRVGLVVPLREEVVVQALLRAEGAAALLGNARVQLRLGVGDALGGSLGECRSAKQRIGHIREGGSVRTLAQLECRHDHRQVGALQLAAGQFKQRLSQMH